MQYLKGSDPTLYMEYTAQIVSFYVGKTVRHLQTRFKGHMDIKKPTAVTEHRMKTNHVIREDDVKILETGKSDIKLLIKKSLTCKKLKPNLNSNVTLYPLELF